MLTSLPRSSLAAAAVQDGGVVQSTRRDKILPTDDVATERSMTTALLDELFLFGAADPRNGCMVLRGRPVPLWFKEC